VGRKYTDEELVNIRRLAQTQASAFHTSGQSPTVVLELLAEIEEFRHGIREHGLRRDLYELQVKILQEQVESLEGELNVLKNSIYCAYCDYLAPAGEQAPLLIEAHIKACPNHPMRRLEEEVASLRHENTRLKQGDFTEEEFQELCHNLPTPPTGSVTACGRFASGCLCYQVKLMGAEVVSRALADTLIRASRKVSFWPHSSSYGHDAWARALAEALLSEAENDQSPGILAPTPPPAPEQPEVTPYDEPSDPRCGRPPPRLPGSRGHLEDWKRSSSE
jgi:hypothetical protein